MSFGEMWNAVVDFFNREVWLKNLLVSVLILVAGIILIKIVMVATRKLLSKTKIERIAQQFLCTILKFVLWILLILMVLAENDVEITGILAAFTAVVLAVGMALQNAIANVANGIIIISSHMFKKGDYIIINGVEGKITDINFMFTTLITNDNKKVTLPNTSILSSNVTNLGAYPKRRVDFTFGVAYETDVELVKKVVTDVMKSDGRVYLDPAPFCRLKELNSSSIDFFANCWCDNDDYWDVYYYIIENVYNEFKRNNISIPYNQIEVRERKDNVVMPYTKQALPERKEKERSEDDRIDLEYDSFKVAMQKAHHKKELKQKEKAEKEAKKKVEKEKKVKKDEESK